MNFVFRMIERAAARPADAIVAELKANRDGNIAAIEAQVGQGTALVQAAETVIAKAVHGNAIVSEAYNIFVKPEMETVLNGFVAQGSATVPPLYDALLAFADKEDAELHKA